VKPLSRILGEARLRLLEMPAVALCRDRCDFLEEALRQSYAFADSHLAYSKSLDSLGLVDSFALVFQFRFLYSI